MDSARTICLPRPRQQGRIHGEPDAPGRTPLHTSRGGHGRRSGRPRPCNDHVASSGRRPVHTGKQGARSLGFLVNSETRHREELQPNLLLKFGFGLFAYSHERHATSRILTPIFASCVSYCTYIPNKGVREKAHSQPIHIPSMSSFLVQICTRVPVIESTRMAPPPLVFSLVRAEARTHPIREAAHSLVFTACV